MALDRSLLESAARGTAPPTLRFYGWDPPAVSLGRFQQTDGVDLAYARSRGWEIVRRPTGGRAVLHHLELTYSIVLPPETVGGAGVRTSYAVLKELLDSGLHPLLGSRPSGAAAAPRPAAATSCAAAAREANCFAQAAECDTLVPEGKLVGSAQVRYGGALLQHGSILLDAEPDAWTTLFGSPGRLVSLRTLLGRSVSRGEVEDALLAAFEQAGIGYTPGEPTSAEVGRAGELVGDAEGGNGGWGTGDGGWSLMAEIP